MWSCRALPGEFQSIKDKAASTVGPEGRLFALSLAAGELSMSCKASLQLKAVTDTDDYLPPLQQRTLLSNGALIASVSSNAAYIQRSFAVLGRIIQADDCVVVGMLRKFGQQFKRKN